jgi:glutamate/tyrosine decarboxylase-like PLP-dependent enzyme
MSMTDIIHGLPSKGASRLSVLAALQEFRRSDAPWRGGRIWAGVYDPGEEVYETIKAANAEFLTENSLYFHYYPSLLRLERELVRTIADLLGGGASAVGNFSTGGTDSIMTALRASRDFARAERNVIGVPEIVLPVTAHPSFHKSAHFLGMKVIVTPVIPGDFRADVKAMRAAITPNTILLVGSAASYTHGVVDSIPEIAALAREHGLLCHVDACIGGIHLSIMSRAGMAVPEFNLSVPGVTSLSVDLHKFGYAAKNASVVLYHDKALRKYGLWSCSETTGYAVMNTTMLSSRSGGPLAGAWAGMQALGLDGYINIVTQTQDATQRLIGLIRQMPELEMLGRPDMCLLAFAVRKGVPTTIFDIDAAMMKLGWYLQPAFSAEGCPAAMHITVNFSSVPHVDAMAADLRASVDELIASPVKRDVPSLVREVQRELENPAKNLMDRVAPILGLVGQEGKLFGDFAQVSAVLDALPRKITDKLLVEFMNDLYV